MVEPDVKSPVWLDGTSATKVGVTRDAATKPELTSWDCCEIARERAWGSISMGGLRWWQTLHHQYHHHCMTRTYPSRRYRHGDQWPRSVFLLANLFTIPPGCPANVSMINFVTMTGHAVMVILVMKGLESRPPTKKVSSKFYCVLVNVYVLLY